MAQTETKKLDGGDLFPTMTLNLVDGHTLALPADLSHDVTILLGYRGHW